ncbi:uncharacterized protein BP01DRAFT_393329 [Aspergillus saccharolyticus JOP 1030-1]|uniref:P-loop containing nucleoside triphosphate hydrolase protein n=1 Tax=Aspergillus saccharolyticus JOP 1030-1 TaxID=1450539 RepID=A0A318Z8G7_9EURO|nr:hypothetical protein BP01DRAFT_393329 [Aspergillus saccharolyticus JOP 1030-1]PYH43459.1 hypothetical protein BP01DRAFT_393329 [Aspergillus saccharolyticus JOP 1030-1]
MTRTDSDPTAQRLLLVSVPRTASNLLLKVLNIHEQPSLHTNNKGGYFFFDAFTAEVQSGLLTTPPSAWSTSTVAEVRSAFQTCLNALEEFSREAETTGKRAFAKEHAFWFLNPLSFHPTNPEEPASDDDDLTQSEEELFRLTLPSKYGKTNTFSSENRTILPDEYLRTWRMAFIIRHPALTFPSFYRAMLKMSETGYLVDDEESMRGTLATNMSMRWTRLLVEWCLRHRPGEPVLLLDAHDLIHDPVAVRRFCNLAGLDESVVKFEWGAGEPHQRKRKEEAPDEATFTKEQREYHAAAKIMFSTLEGSSGMMKDKTPSMVDVGAEVGKWRAEFGEEAAGMLERAVEEAMPDYEFLMARRVRG